MIKILPGLLGAVLLCSSTRTWGCDVCNYSSGVQSVGLFPQSTGNYVGLHYMGYQTRSEYPGLFDKSKDNASVQRYDNLQLSVRLHINKHFQIITSLPTGTYRNRDSSSNVRYTGIGDASIQIGYRILLKKDSQEQVLLLHTTCKTPTGAFIPADGQILRAPSPGSGSWDIGLGLNYTYRTPNWGYYGELSFLLTTPNKQRYKVGNRSILAGTIFHSLKKNQWTLMPQAGFRSEYSLHDYQHYDRKWLDMHSGGLLLFASAGGQILYKQTGFRLLAYIPVVQHYAGGSVHSSIRSEAALFLIF